MIAAMRLSLPAAEFAVWLAAAFAAGASLGPMLRWAARRWAR